MPNNISWSSYTIFDWDFKSFRFDYYYYYSFKIDPLYTYMVVQCDFVCLSLVVKAVNSVVIIDSWRAYPSMSPPNTKRNLWRGSGGPVSFIEDIGGRVRFFGFSMLVQNGCIIFSFGSTRTFFPWFPVRAGRTCVAVTMSYIEKRRRFSRILFHVGII